MGKLSVADVVALVRSAGVRAARGYPGEQMPAIEIPAAAVNLHREDADSCTMAVWVVCPRKEGAEGCEDLARTVAEALREGGGSCTIEACQFDGHADRFSVRILAAWEAEAEECPFTVRLGTVLITGPVSFTARQTSTLTEAGQFGEDAPAAVLSSPGPWVFTLEERYPRGKVPPNDPAEPFTLYLHRGTVRETYSGCRWLDVRREDTYDGLRLVRQGRAEGREVTRDG